MAKKTDESTRALRKKRSELKDSILILQLAVARIEEELSRRSKPARKAGR